MKAKGHLAYNRPQPWGQAASDMLHVEDSGEWNKRFESFSFYLKDLAKAKEKTKSSLWRLRSAGRYYNELRKKLDPEGKKFPELEDPRVKATPECLELLAKISRVAPTELVDNLETRAMAGTVSRGDLRDIWGTYKPVLLGKTARGQKAPPEYDKNNREMKNALVEADALAPIVLGGPSWLEVKGAAYVYKVVRISTNKALKHLYPSAPDVVVLLAKDEHSTLQIHGIEAVKAGFNTGEAGFNVGDIKRLRNYESYETSVDFLWVASKYKPNKFAKLPEGVGFLLTTLDTVKVLQKAVEIPEHDPAKREELLKALLREATRNKLF